MRKKTIGIDINEVLRAHFAAVEQQYINYKKKDGDDPQIIKPFNTYDYDKHFIFKDKLVDIKYLKPEISDDIPASDYVVDKVTGESPADPLLFDKHKELLTAKDQLHRFLYEDYSLEVFGHAGKVYGNVINDLKNFKVENEDKYNIIIVSLEEKLSVPPTLYFLSKVGVDLAEYYFSSIPDKIWDKIDICVTANPRLLNTKPRGKQVIKVVREFNEQYVNQTFQITTLSELLSINLKKKLNTGIFSWLK